MRNKRKRLKPRKSSWSRFILALKPFLNKLKESLCDIKRNIRKTYRKYKYMDKTKAQFFMISTIISLFCLFVAGTYAYFNISEYLNSSIITIADLKYQLASTNTNFKDNSITVNAGESINLQLDLKSLNQENTKYALDYVCDDPNVKVMHVGKREQNVLGEIAGLNSIINIKILIENKSNTSQTVTFNLKGGYLQNILDSNIIEAAPNMLMARSSSSYTGEFWSQAANIKSVIFENTMNEKENVAYTYDVSDKKDKSIMSYLVPDTEDNTKYVLYIQSEGSIPANPNSSYFFYNFTNLESIVGMEYFDTGLVTDMSAMFQGCSSLTTLDLSSFNTNSVSNMSSMFYNCSNLTVLGISKFNTSQVTDMSSMFRDCVSLTVLNVSNFNTSNVTNMAYIFSGLSGISTLDLSNFDTSQVTDISYMFSGCSGLTALDLSNFNTSNVTNMFYLFSDCRGLKTLNVSNFNTNNVTSMSYMFYGCSGLTALNISNFNTNNVIGMSHMFSSCSGLTSLNIDNFNTSKVTNMQNMFSSCSGLIALDLSNFNTSNVTSMSSMFYNCRNLTELDLSSFNTSKVTTMLYMFQNCGNLTTLNISSFDTSNVTVMSYMFQNCSVLKTLDLSNFDTSKVTTMSHMFYYCSDLTTLNISGFDTSNVTNFSGMFSNCSNLIMTIIIKSTKSDSSYSSMFSRTSTESGAQVTLRYSSDASSLVDNMIATKSSASNVIKESDPLLEHSITINGDDTVSSDVNSALILTPITLFTSKEGYVVSSFKMNGKQIIGNMFKMPDENVTISDIVFEELTIVESEHNPYPNSLNNKEYLNKTFEGATSLTVVLDYQTQGTSYDWIYLYDKDNKTYGKYGGTTRKTETISIPGDTIRIVFRTNSSGNNYYGFKATIKPNY